MNCKELKRKRCWVNREAFLSFTYIAYKNLLVPTRFEPRISWTWVLSFSGRLFDPFSRRTFIVLPKLHIHLTTKVRRVGRGSGPSFLTTRLQPRRSSQFQTVKDWTLDLNYKVLANKMSIFFIGAAAQRGPWPPHFWGFLITHNDAPQSVGLLWTSDQLVAETST